VHSMDDLDEDLAAVLELCPAVELGLRDSDFGPLAFSSLRRHFNTLKVPDLIGRTSKHCTSSNLEPVPTRKVDDFPNTTACSCLRGYPPLS